MILNYILTCNLTNAYLNHTHTHTHTSLVIFHVQLLIIYLPTQWEIHPTLEDRRQHWEIQPTAEDYLTRRGIHPTLDVGCLTRRGIHPTLGLDP